METRRLPRMGPLAPIILVASLLLCGRKASAQAGERPVEYPPYDGWYNNYAHPSWGGADTQLFRKVPPAYSDGTYEPAGQDRPSPMNLSRIVFTGPTGFKSYRNRTALMVFFGQQLVEEVLDAQRPGCPPEYFNLEIPKEHEHYSNDPDAVNVLPVLRSRYDMKTGYTPNNPRQQLNEISAWMDGTLVYGPNKAWTDSIREFKDGLLQVDDVKGPYGGEFPRNNSIRLPYINPPPPRDHPKLKPISRFNKIGNPRGNENPFLLTMGIMWFRYHNAWARKLKNNHPDWTDEKLFNEARKMVIGVYQKIVTEDWIVGWLGQPLPHYNGYNPTVHPGIAHVFQSAAMRFGHTMVPPGVYRRNKDCVFRKTTKRTYFENKLAVRTCNSFWNPQEAVYEHDIDEFIMGMASQVAEREDNIITPDLRGNVFGPLEFNRRDLMAINIQRARDHGIPDFNSVRKAYGLPPKDWDTLIVHPDIDPDRKILNQIKELYGGDFSKVDLWVGGMLEVNERPGETFRAIISDQFQRIRDGDRFWYENTQNGLYTEDEIQLIRSTTVKDVIMDTTTIGPDDIQDNPFIFRDGDKCPTPRQLRHDDGSMENCTEKQTFDYFSGSKISYVLSLVVLFSTFFIFLGILFLLAKYHNKKVEEERAKIRHKSIRNKDQAPAHPTFTVSEWQGPKEKWHNVKITLIKPKKTITVSSTSNQLLRTIDLNCMLRRGDRVLDIFLSADQKMDLAIIKIPKEYDLLLRFDSVGERQSFLDSFKKFLDGEPGLASARSASTKQMYRLAVTKEVREKLLKNFFEAILRGMTNNTGPSEWNNMRKEEINDVLQSELTKAEFASALGMTLKSAFLESIFNMADVDRSGSISFKEFLDLAVRFYNGDGQSKMKLLFDMYDVERRGKLTSSQLTEMLHSVLDLDKSRIDAMVNEFCAKAGIDAGRDITFKDFSRLLGGYEKELNRAVLALDVNPKKAPANAKEERFRQTMYGLYGAQNLEAAKRMSRMPMVDVHTVQKEYSDSKVQQFMNKVKRYVETYKLHIFWLTLYTLVCIGIFIERAYYYSVEREHSGLRRIAGDGVTVTRGAASGMMFTYGCLLLTMCRNIITALRETFLNRYIPFDAAVDFHKYISLLALIFTILHIIGHCINFYHVSTQTANDLNCLFRNFFHATDELPKFHDWLWNTITGFTGVLLTIQLFMIYIFATQYARRHSFRSFWITHNSYVIFFALMFLHGIGRLVQPPLSHYYMLGPIIVFAIDQLISVSRKKVEITVVRAELLPSDVTYLEIKRPHNFVYKSGQWIRIACTEQGKNEYHPFTLSSAPHEENLGVHIRGVGPWTYQLRHTYNPEAIKFGRWPKVFIDGPYGEGHQDWNKYPVSVMVGGGIGVTPFTSILKDIAHKSKSGAKVYCKKVYFLWVTRTQKQFEWVTDIIRSVEDADQKGLVAVHIFITEFKQMFDIRTTMLYICEKHFQKISGCSLFTGLRSVTHFGRPDFNHFLTALTQFHNDVEVIGVFSCGPPPMTNNVEKACRQVTNKTDTLFLHHYENF